MIDERIVRIASSAFHLDRLQFAPFRQARIAVIGDAYEGFKGGPLTLSLYTSVETFYADCEQAKAVDYYEAISPVFRKHSPLHPNTRILIPEDGEIFSSRLPSVRPCGCGACVALALSQLRMLALYDHIFRDGEVIRLTGTASQTEN